MLTWYALNSNFLRGPGSRWERNSWDAGSSINKEADLVLNPGLLCFSGGYRAWMKGPGTHHWVGGSGLGSQGSRGQCDFQCFPRQMGQGVGGSFLWEHSLLKWPACPLWKHVFRFGLCPREASLSAVIKASCCLSFLFSFSRSFLSFFKSLL
jgi:hypothetical protein